MFSHQCFSTLKDELSNVGAATPTVVHVHTTEIDSIWPSGSMYVHILISQVNFIDPNKLEGRSEGELELA